MALIQESVLSPAKPVFEVGMWVRRAVPGMPGELAVLLRPNSNLDGAWVVRKEVNGRETCWDESNFEPIEREWAKPVEESDEQWLKRQVFELTGIEALVTVKGDEFRATAGGGLTCVFYESVRYRDAHWVRALLGDARWPLKDSPAGVGPATVATNLSTDAERHGAPGADQTVSARPTPAETYCAECGALANMAGGAFVGIETPLCDEHRARRCALIDGPQPRQPCGDGYRCVYCKHETEDGCMARPAADLLTANAMRFLTSEKEARKRLAALEARELRLNDQSPAEVKMLDGAQDALRHWPSVEDWEP